MGSIRTGTDVKENRSRSRSTTGMREDRESFPKMLLVAGDGRNVGKTTFSLQLIRRLSVKTDVTGIKTTPHRHLLTDGLEILEQNDDYMIALEKGAHQKDSAQMLQAGASEVYLIVAAQEHLGEAFSRISGQIRNKICVVESGGLAAYVAPAVFFFVRNHAGEISKKHYLEFDPVVVTNRDRRFDFDMEKLDVVAGELVLNE